MPRSALAPSGTQMHSLPHSKLLQDAESYVWTPCGISESMIHIKEVKRKKKSQKIKGDRKKETHISKQVLDVHSSFEQLYTESYYHIQ